MTACILPAFFMDTIEFIAILNAEGEEVS